MRNSSACFTFGCILSLTAVTVPGGQRVAREDGEHLDRQRNQANWRAPVKTQGQIREVAIMPRKAKLIFTDKMKDVV